MGYSGYPFTWSNRRFGSPNFIEERLDRFLCSSSWRDLNVFSSVSHLTSWPSDHCPVVFEFRDQLNSGMHKGVRPRFHYKAFWKGYDGCKDIVKDCWQTDEYLQSD